MQIHSKIIAVAPMMACTDRHARYFLRLIAPNVLLYTEMITTHALIHGDRNYLLGYDPSEHPLALQLGGNDPTQLSYCARLGEEFGYDEVNLNVGCPSDRVRNGQFGACLMLQPNLVAECVDAMIQQVKIPITVKCRLGVDQKDRYEDLYAFIEIIKDAGCKTFIIHARKAWLSGLSPKQNREIPPLRYDLVRQINTEFPELNIIINGGISTLEAVQEHLHEFDGVMIGRAAYNNPYLLAQLEATFYAKDHVLTRAEIIDRILPYIQEQLDRGVKLNSITRHMLGLFQGVSGAATWRRYLSDHTHRLNANTSTVLQALQEVERKQTIFCNSSF